MGFLIFSVSYIGYYNDMRVLTNIWHTPVCRIKSMYCNASLPGRLVRTNILTYAMVCIFLTFTGQFLQQTVMFKVGIF